MAHIRYTRYEFHQPLDVTANQFLHLKQNLSANPGASLDPNFQKTFTSHFKKTLRGLAAGVICFVVFLIIFNLVFTTKATQFEWQRTVVLVPTAIAAIIGGLALGRILLEGPSFASYVTERNDYFGRLKHAVLNSPDYPAFEKSFYGTGGKAGRNKLSFKQEWLQESRQSPVTLNSFLTRLFRLIDLHYWKVFLVGAVIFVLVKYVFK